MKRSERYALIRPLREQGLTWADIGARLGISLKTAHDIYSDPTGDKKRARMRASDARHRHACPGCGADIREAVTTCFDCYVTSIRREAPSCIPGQLWAWDYKAQRWVEVRLDIPDWERFKGDRWRLVSKGYVARIDSGRQGKTRYLHRLIFDLADDARWPSGERVVVDHRNRDPLDNRRANIWLCTMKQNCANRGGRFAKAAA